MAIIEKIKKIKQKAECADLPCFVPLSFATFCLKKRKRRGKRKIFAQRCSIGGVKFVWHPLDRITSAVLASNVYELFFLFSFILFVVPSPLFSLKT